MRVGPLEVAGGGGHLARTIPTTDRKTALLHPGHSCFRLWRVRGNWDEEPADSTGGTGAGIHQQQRQNKQM